MLCTAAFVEANNMGPGGSSLQPRIMIWYTIIFGALIGAAVGSFLSCAQWRVPRRISLQGRSICPSCRQPLKNRWNVPILGWLMLRGRSGCCDQPIGARYLVLEVGAAALGVIIALLIGVQAMFIATLGLVVIVGVIGERRATQPPPA